MGGFSVHRIVVHYHHTWYIMQMMVDRDGSTNA